MLNEIRSAAFRRDYRRVSRRCNNNIESLETVIAKLRNGEPLPENNDHALTGNWKGYRECHITPNWLLIYKTDETTLYLAATGSHSDLF